MQLKNYLKSKMHFIGALSLLFGLASCGSYQYAGQDDDGIYRTTERTVKYGEVVEVQEEPNTQGSDYYQNYFRDKVQELNNASDEDVIFTDIDSYEGDYNVENDSLTYQDGYAGWGQDNENVTINIYGGHLFNSIRWNRPYYPRWMNNYGYGYGYTWGAYGFYDNYWCPPYYGYNYLGWNAWNYGHPYIYNGYGNNRYYGNYYNGYRGRSLAYNATRRGSIYSNSAINNINRRSLANRVSTSRRSNGTLNSSNRNSSSDINRDSRPRRSTALGNTSNSKPRVNSRPRSSTKLRGTSLKPRVNSRPRSTSTSRPRANTSRSRSSSSNNRSSYNRSSSNSRSSSSNVRSSSSSSRSSSSGRSSGSRSSSSKRGNNN